MIKSLFNILFLAVIFTVFAGAVYAANLSIRIEQPKSPTNDNSFKINFVTLDTESRAVTVKCFKKGPSDADFVQFGSDIALPAGGNSGDCIVDSSVMNSLGTYQFYTTAQVNSDNATSPTVTVSYKNEAPGTPYNFSKERVGTCEYKIKFKTAADNGRTHKVEIYMSSFTSFSADSGTKVGEVGIGSDQEGSFTTSAPDCNKTFYFAIRAFDDAENGSGVVGDSSTTVIIKESTTIITQTSEQAGVGAIPPVADQAGEILGEAAKTEGGVLGEATPGAQPQTTPTQQPGLGGGLGELFTSRNFLLIAVVGVYFYRRFRQ